MSLRMPRKSELPWFWRPWALTATVCLVVALAAVCGLTGYWMQARVAATGLGRMPPASAVAWLLGVGLPPAPALAWLLGIGLFAVGVGIGLPGGPVLFRYWQETREKQEHFRRNGPRWTPLATFTREYWRAVRGTWSSRRGFRDSAILVALVWGSAACGGVVQYAATRHVGPGSGIAFYGALAGLYLRLMRIVSSLEE